MYATLKHVLAQRSSLKDRSELLPYYYGLMKRIREITITADTQCEIYDPVIEKMIEDLQVDIMAEGQLEISEIGCVNKKSWLCSLEKKVEGLMQAAEQREMTLNSLERTLAEHEKEEITFLDVSNAVKPPKLDPILAEAVRDKPSEYNVTTLHRHYHADMVTTCLLLRYASQNSLDESSQKQVPRNSFREKPPYRNHSHTQRAFEVFNIMRKQHLLCDVRLVADSLEVQGHKMVLAAASPYFHAMFTSFEESRQERIVLQGLDPYALQLLVDYVYTSEIHVTEDNVQVLLPAANLLQLSDVRDACCDFLQSQLHPTNCLGIRAFADLHGCLDLLAAAEAFIEQHFSEVVEGEEFLALSHHQVCKLICSDRLEVQSEEKVFECVVNWVNQDLPARQCHMGELMEYVRLPLLPQDYLMHRVEEEPLLQANLKCKDYLIEALKYHLLKGEQRLSLNTPRTKPRQPIGLPKVMLVVGGQAPKAIRSVECYDFATETWVSAAEMPGRRCRAGLVVLGTKVYAVGGFNGSLRVKTVDVYDITTDSWSVGIGMGARRSTLGVAVLNNCIYAVGGFDGSTGLNSAEMFDPREQTWAMIASMSTRRSSVGVGVVNNLLYAVGGYDGASRQCLSSVECYNADTDEWTPVADMAARRSGAGVGVLDGILYAVGGHDGPLVRKSVEAFDPETGCWTPVSDMALCRRNAGVVALKGLLYVVGGDDGTSNLSSVEVYHPKSNTWSMLPSCMSIGRSYAGVAIIDKLFKQNTDRKKRYNRSCEKLTEKTVTSDWLARWNIQMKY
ncbi:kelch-like protein 3 isoform X4 [Halyomorpha halys]